MDKNGPLLYCITDKGIACLAALHAGLLHEGDADSAAAFERFWTEYAEKSSRNFDKAMRSSTQHIENLMEMLQSERRERARDRADQRKTHALFAVMFTCGFMIGQLLLALP